MSNCEGDTVWEFLFPKREQVSWDAFLITFETYFSGKYPKSYIPNGISVRRLLFYALAHDNSRVTKTAFDNFVQLFGPVRLCLVKVATNLFTTPDEASKSATLHPWYHGAITRNKAEQILHAKSPTVGDFLVRLSESQVGKFTLAYVSSHRTLKNVLVHNYGESGYGLEATQAQSVEGHTFEKLSDFITLHSHKLHTGIPSTLHLQSVQDQDRHTSGSSKPPSSTSNTHATSVNKSALLHSRTHPPTEHSTSSRSAHHTSTILSQSESSQLPPPPLTRTPSEESPYGTFPMPPTSLTSTKQSAPILTHSHSFFNEAEGDDNYGCFVPPPPAHHNSHFHSSSPASLPSPTTTSSTTSLHTSALPIPQLSRRQLSSNLDDSRHLLKENKYASALEMAQSVIDEISKKRKGSPSLAEEEDSDSMEDMHSEDLLLMAKALFQKGKIREKIQSSGNQIDSQERLAAFSRSHTYLSEFYRRSESSDNFHFEEFSLFVAINRKMADLLAAQGNTNKAEYHYAECSGLMLQDPDLVPELRNKELVDHIRKQMPSHTASEASATALLESGMQEYKKGARFYAPACDYLLKALICSRLCGAEGIELRAVANLGTVESAFGQNILAIHHYHQCCILCRLIKKDNDSTLKQILFKKSMLLMKVGYYHRTIDCINESIGLATSMTNIEKLEALKQKALDKLASHH